MGTMVCMTHAILDYCRESGLRPHDARVVYDAIDESWLRTTRSVADTRADLGVPADATCLGILGNVQEWKGQRILVDAMELVASRYPKAHCLIIGGVHRAGEEYAEELRGRVRRLGLGERVHFVGFREDVPDVIQALDVVVHASVRPEPFGRVILEGMLLGKPVVASKAGGVLELIEHEKTGYLVPPGDVPALADCLTTILAQPERAAAMGRYAAEWARKQFSLARQVEEMSQIYEESTRANGS
jgi:glycosyltransferase involved in cell wall biosynthesis